MDFTTPVKLPLHHPTIGLHSQVMLLGSCFADHMGQRLTELMPDKQVVVNPNGVLYNPKSMVNALRHALHRPEEEEDDLGLFQSADGLWHHWEYSTKFIATDQNQLAAQLHLIREDTHRRLHHLDVLALTFSTDTAYRLKDGEAQGLVVANCHKQPAQRFEEITLDGQQLLQEWCEVLDRLFALRPHLQVVLTLSPYRYAKYGMHQNALIKARLLLLMEALCQAYTDRVYYFPAYEIVTDELRDYRFYDTDMLHPSQQAVDYVWQRFHEWCVDPALSEYGKRKTAIERMLQHRPMNPLPEAQRQWAMKKAEKMAEFQKWAELWMTTH